METSGKPRHEQISNGIKEQIQSGALNPGQQLPSESELSSTYDVSRVTVRHALSTLEAEGYIYKRQGLGSFVKEAAVRQQIQELTDFSEELKMAGIEATSKITFFKPVKNSPAHVLLGVEPNKPVLQLERIRFGNGNPFAVDITWLPVLYGQLLDESELESRTIFDILETDFDIPIIEGRYKFAAVNADKSLAKKLKTKEDAALLMLHRCAKTIGSKMVYVQHRFYLSDKISYEIVLNRDQGEETGNGMHFSHFGVILS
jgi:GntR family transcriptional regulator